MNFQTLPEIILKEFLISKGMIFKAQNHPVGEDSFLDSEKDDSVANINRLEFVV